MIIIAQRHQQIVASKWKTFWFQNCTKCASDFFHTNHVRINLRHRQKGEQIWHTTFASNILISYSDSNFCGDVIQVQHATTDIAFKCSKAEK